MNKIVKEMTRCKECQNHKIARVYTADSFEHISGVYCYKCKEVKPRGDFGVQAGLGRLVGTDDNKDFDMIPDWCPLLSKLEVISREPIMKKFDNEDELSEQEIKLLVKGISKIGNIWVSGFFVKEKSGRYRDSGDGRYEELYIPTILCSFSSGGFSKTEVYPETVCRCTGKKDDTGEYLYEHDFIDPKGWNTVEYSDECITIAGDRRLSVVLGGKPFHIYGNSYDRIIRKSREEERLDS